MCPALMSESLLLPQNAIWEGSLCGYSMFVLARVLLWIAEYEVRRQVSLVDSGGVVDNDTRAYNPNTK